MLQIFADALLIAARMQPHHHDDHPRRALPDPEAETKTRRGWFTLSGLLR